MAKSRKVVDSSAFVTHFVLYTILFSIILGIPSNIIIELLDDYRINSTLSAILIMIVFAIFNYLLFYLATIRLCKVEQLDRNQFLSAFEGINKFVFIWAILQIAGGALNLLSYLGNSLSFFMKYGVFLGNMLIPTLLLLIVKFVIVISSIIFIKNWILIRN